MCSRRVLILIGAVLLLLTLATWGQAQSLAFLGDDARACVAVYSLSPGVLAADVLPGAGGGAWVRETNPVGLAHVEADAAPTGGVLPAQVVTMTLPGVVTDVVLFGRPSSPIITVPLDVVTAPARLVTPNAGITEYVWPTSTTWLGQPVSGTLTLAPDSVDGAAGLWAHRDGAVDLLDPTTGVITSFKSDALGAAPAVLNADVPGVVWGLAANRLFLVNLAVETAAVFLGTDAPAAVSHVTFQYGYYSVWFSDPALYGIVELMYHPAHPDDQVRTVYQLPGLRQADDLVRVPTGSSREHWDPFAKRTRTAAGWELWYLDRLHNRLGRLTMSPPYQVVEYDLPAPLALGGLAYDGDRLWFTLLGETVAFDPATEILTRYQAGTLPLVGIGGAAAWSASEDQVYRIWHRYLLFLPEVFDDA